MVLGRDLAAVRHYLSAFAVRVIRIARPKQATSSWGGLEQHTVTASVRRAVSDAVHGQVRVHARPLLIADALARQTLLDLLEAEVSCFRMFAMQQGGGDPDFIGHPDR